MYQFWISLKKKALLVMVTICMGTPSCSIALSNRSKKPHLVVTALDEHSKGDGAENGRDKRQHMYHSENDSSMFTHKSAAPSFNKVGWDDIAVVPKMHS